jgi:ABC-type glucose/galactose transport system permease subunit
MPMLLMVMIVVASGLSIVVVRPIVRMRVNVHPVTMTLAIERGIVEKATHSFDLARDAAS